MSEHLGKDELDPHEDVLPETDPNAEDVFDADMRRPHIPLRGAGAVQFEGRSEVDDLEDQKRILWQARVRAGVQSIGRMVKEFGGFLASFDEWSRKREDYRRAPVVRSKESLSETVLALRVTQIFDPHSHIELDIKDKATEELIIPPGSSFTMLARPQLFFKGKRLCILPEDAEDLLILDVKIGRNSQFAAAGEVSAKAFAIPGGSPFVTNTAQVSMDVSLILMHTGKAERKVPRICFFGVSVE